MADVAARGEMDRIVSLYWDNIDPRVVEAQREVFAHFGLSIDQRERTGTNHGDFLDAFMAEIAEDDVALLMDIDCFPLNRDIVDDRVIFQPQLNQHKPSWEEEVLISNSAEVPAS